MGRGRGGKGERWGGREVGWGGGERKSEHVQPLPSGELLGLGLTHSLIIIISFI